MKKALALLVITALSALAQVPKPSGGGGGGGGGATSSGAADTPQCADGSGGFQACPAGAYSADVASAATWTITNATHGMSTCDVSITAQTESAGVRSWVVPQAWTCAESDYEINITWSTATAGRVVIMKGGGGGGGGGGGAPTDAPYWLSTSNGTLSAEVNLGALADNSVVAVDVATGTATPRAALYTDITPLWDSGACGTDYMRGNGTCDTPSGALPALGTAYQILRVNSGASASEWATLTAGSGTSVTHSVGATTISVDSTQTPLLALDNAFLGDNSFGGTTAYTPSSAQTLVAGDAVTVTTTVKRISTAGAVTSTATPTIADGVDGQLLYIHNSGSNDWTMQDESSLAGSNLCLPSGTSVTLNAGDTVALVFVSASSCWSKLK